MKEQIKQAIADHLCISIDEIDDDSDIFEVLGADSLDGVDLLMTLEEEFDLSIPDEDAVELRTVRKIVNYIQENK
ncbi:MAG: acyl carrier protein [Clostridia bacterium]|nr:acyl carrier protein [Clostridia bacterium]